MPNEIRRRRVPWRVQLPLLVWLVLLWVMLWDDLSWGNVIAGAVLAVVVTRVFFLPPVELSGRVNLWWLLVFTACFLRDMARSAVEVAVRAFTPGYVPTNAVIALRLRTESDLIMLMTGQALTLIPGSLIVEVDRHHHILFVHVFDVSSDADVERARDGILRTEERLIRALGSRAEVRALRAGVLPTYEQRVRGGDG